MAKANKSFGYTDAFPSRFRDLADEKGCKFAAVASIAAESSANTVFVHTHRALPAIKSIVR